METTFENRPGRRGAFVGVWLAPVEKRQLTAMAAEQGRSISAIVREKLNLSPIGQECSGEADGMLSVDDVAEIVRALTWHHERMTKRGDSWPAFERMQKWVAAVYDNEERRWSQP